MISIDRCMLPSRLLQIGFSDTLDDEGTYHAMCVYPDRYQPTDDAFKVWADSFPEHKTENGLPVEAKDCTVTPCIEESSESRML